MNLNKAILIGRLTDDPEKRALPSGQPVVNFSIATNRNWTDKEGNKKEDVQFHNIVAFGKLADVAGRYLEKGGLVMIEGRIQTRSWEDSNGNRRYRTEIITESLQLGPRSASSGGGMQGNKSQGEQSRPDDSGSQKDADEDIPVIDQDEDIDSDDIPF